MNIKRFIPLKLKIQIKYLCSQKTNSLVIRRKSIFVFLGADYGNLGDCAITYAQICFLKENFPEYEVIEVPISKTYTWMKELKSKISPDDIITIVGGGNTSDLYEDIEWCRQFVIKQFPNNKIISFPQTINFSDTARGKKRLREAISIYSRHKYLTLCAREEKSYKTYKANFKKNEVILVPDIVLSLDKSEPKYDRKGIIACLRNDKEQLVSNEDKNNMLQEISKKYELSYYDTHIGSVTLKPADREKELGNIWIAFKKAECVITDRLHGMIFCAITGTPCVVLPNNNNKIKGVYQWLKECSNIVLTNSTLDITEKVEMVKNSEIQIPKLIKRFELIKTYMEI